MVFHHSTWKGEAKFKGKKTYRGGGGNRNIKIKLRERIFSSSYERRPVWFSQRVDVGDAKRRPRIGGGEEKRREGGHPRGRRDGWREGKVTAEWKGVGGGQRRIAGKGGGERSQIREGGKFSTKRIFTEKKKDFDPV